MIKPSFPGYVQVRKDRRDVMDALDIAVKQSRLSEAININSIRPVEDRFFTASGAMSTAGYNEMWWYLDDIVRRRYRNLVVEASPFRHSVRTPTAGSAAEPDFRIAERAVSQRLQHLRRNEEMKNQIKRRH